MMLKHLIAVMVILLMLMTQGCKLRGMSFFSVPTDLQSQQALNDLNVNAIHYPILWSDVEKNPGVYDFTKYDNIISIYQDKIQSCIVGNVHNKPSWINPDSNWGGFLQSNYNFIYSTVYHLAGTVSYWWIMPEYNEARLRVLYGWLSGYWANSYDKLDQLCATQYWAVVDAYTQYQVDNGGDRDTMPFIGIIYHADIHSDIHHHVLGPGQISGSILAGEYDWVEMCQRWNMYQNIIGLDTYPNYYNSDPIRDEDLPTKLQRALSFCKPVFVLETQYPYAREILPEPVTFTEEKQRIYFANTYVCARDMMGVAGYFVFNLYADGVPKQYTSKDLETLSVLGPAFHSGKAQILIDYLLANYEYCISKDGLGRALLLSEHGLGVMSRSGYKTQCYNAIKTMYKVD